MVPSYHLQPTLWRTCRVLANHSRLQIFGLVIQKPGQTVSALAKSLKRTLPVASQSLRALEARGLLSAHRAGRRVEYRPGPTTAMATAPDLVVTLRRVFQQEAEPIEMIFHLATAFTHPRRIEIFRTLAKEPQTLGQLQEATKISVRALLRHLGKLESRGFVECQLGRYTTANQSDAFGRVLARAATG